VTGLTAAPAPRYAGFWVRVGATLLDILWIVPLVLGFGYVLFGAAYFNVNAGAFRGWGDFAFTNLLPALAVLAFWQVRGATPGKILLHLRIVDATTLGKVAFGRLVLRYVVYGVSLLFAPLALLMALGYLWVAFDKRCQGLHDKLARTVVIRVDD